MIGMLNGRVVEVNADNVLIEVGGVGYETRMPSADLASLRSGQETRVYTSLSVSQDAITLFGFLSLASKRMFLQLQKVSGIGPKVALSLLSTLPPDRLARAVADGDATALAKAPGLGKKGAQKIILELKGSIDLDAIESGHGTASRQTGADPNLRQVVEGLMSLGWRQADAQTAVENVCRDNGVATPLAEDDVPRVLKLALTSLDRGR
ncbi:Holliday junction branch migration protein RuvA [Bifidobacterium amazonense]|uniref:Holliday junction branch migration complex subunit RuvA n=1 Tax=Bifidobacterium amazonense TaxID=2809027 RepID=A0ABS9VSR8_9BIFI|nr:Holliday junction branch migration protein RuvA [Bifidobacterium amazonense]MCH9275030.1 Holliday junction branch migration protein RuvA [Bifidobacterium amazonense]